MLRDVVFLFCDSWVDARPDDDCAKVACQFISALLQVVYTPDSDLLKENTLSICSILRLWLPPDEDRVCNGLITWDYVRLVDLDLSPILAMLRTQAAATGGAHAGLHSR